MTPIDHANFLTRYLAEIVAGLILVLLAVLKLLGHRANKRKEDAEDTIVTRADLLELRLELKTQLHTEFEKLHIRLEQNMHSVNARIDNHLNMQDNRRNNGGS